MSTEFEQRIADLTRNYCLNSSGEDAAGKRDALASFLCSVMAEVSAYWAALAANWDDIRTAPEPEKYKIMQAILKPIQDADRNHISLGNGASISFR